MSTETDNIFAAGLYNMLKGVRADIDVEKTIDAEITRAEGMAKLNSRIKQQSSPSGYVNKDTGKPILQSELANVSEDQRMLAGDFSIGQQKKQYTAQQDMTAAARAEELQRQMANKKSERDIKLADEKSERDYQLGRDKTKEAGLNKRAALKGKKEDFTQKEIMKFTIEANKAYDNYVAKAREFDPEVAVDEKKEWLRGRNRPLYNLIYGDEPDESYANGSAQTPGSMVAELIKRKGAQTSEQPSVETAAIPKKAVFEEREAPKQMTKAGPSTQDPSAGQLEAISKRDYAPEEKKKDYRRLKTDQKKLLNKLMPVMEKEMFDKLKMLRGKELDAMLERLMASNFGSKKQRG